MSLKSNFGTFIDRSINELRTGRPIVIKENKNYWMFFNIEHSENKILNQFNKYLLKEKYLLITKQKAQSIFNNKITSNIFLKIDEKISNKSILNLFLDKDIIENQLSDLKEFKRVIIGDKKNPSEKAANKILEYLKD